MQSNLVDFIQVLRTHEVRISPAETLDAVEVTRSLGYADRNLLRDGLAMTLAKTPEEEVIFLHCFDRYFQRISPTFQQRTRSPRPTPRRTHHPKKTPPRRQRISLPARSPHYNWPPSIAQHCNPCYKPR